MLTRKELNLLIYKRVGRAMPELVDDILELNNSSGVPKTQREDMAPVKETRVLSAEETR